MSYTVNSKHVYYIQAALVTPARMCMNTYIDDAAFKFKKYMQFFFVDTLSSYFTKI